MEIEEDLKRKVCLQGLNVSITLESDIDSLNDMVETSLTTIEKLSKLKV